MNCVRQWFGVDLSTYNIFLIPLAFIRDVAPIEGMNLNSEEKHLLKYLTKLADEKSNEPDADFSVTLPIEIRVKRSKEKGASSFIISDAPDAIPVKLEEENIREKYPWDYIVLTKRLESRYSDFKINEKYHKIRRPLEADTRFCMVRLLDPGNPKSSQKKFYNSNILKQFDEHYVRKGAV
jgi:hypothetical protein